MSQQFWGLFVHLPCWDLVIGFQRIGKCLLLLKSVQKCKTVLTGFLQTGVLSWSSVFEFVKLRVKKILSHAPSLGK